MVVVLASLCGLVVGTLGVLFWRQHTGSAFDENVYWSVYKQFVGQRGLLQTMLVPTEPVLLVIVVGLIVMVAVARHRPRLAVLAVAGPLIAVMLSSAVLKPVFGRTINNGSLAFPSGHTTGMVSVLTVLVLAVMTTRSPWHKSVSTLAIVGALVVAAIGAIALVGMKFHYITDTFGGACVAIATVLVVALVIDRIADRRKRLTAARQDPVTTGVAL
ncbi:phosphatase PAP2 family protein [Kibdelosporangium persicum]